MEKLLKIYNEYLTLYNSAKQESTLVSKKSFKLDFELEKYQLYALYKTDEQMLEKGYVRNQSIYINQYNGHRIRYNKIHHLSIKKQNLLFLQSMKYISDLVSYYENKRNIDRKIYLIKSEKINVENSLKEYLREDMLNSLFTSKSKYIKHILESKVFNSSCIIKKYEKETLKIINENNIEILNNYYTQENLYEIYKITKNIEIKRDIFKIINTYLIQKEFEIFYANTIKGLTK
jgi:hypothetical protein